ncbi:MAG: acylphosphatase [Candidatus Marinimicrobia bacterium]|nr:acylphosphatase [Candidatus Neomarinimicrobiota bacterium]
MDTAISFLVRGRVQGVAFRAFVKSSAQQLGLKGWVKNDIDGSVRGQVEGDQGLVIEFMKQIRIGNRWSDVEALEEKVLPCSGEFTGFEIRY